MPDFSSSLHCIGEAKMKFTIAFAGLLGVFLTPALASYNIDVNNDNNSGGSGQQSVSVNNEHNVANVDNNNGWNSWNALWDYDTGFAVIRLFKEKSCIVHKMNKEAMPSLQDLDTLVKEKKLQGKGPGGPPPRSLRFSVNPNRVDNLDKFGKAIVAMCKGLPTYMAEETQGSSLISYSENCISADILWILNISFCGGVVEN
uniref:Gastrokine-1 n=1 Tax=Catagonus wagneri TaxID=51154 RepID=A0A8C3WZA3_9CETA